jgi:hypothetical protein
MCSTRHTRAADTSKPVLDDFAALERLSSSILRALNPAQYLVTRAGASNASQGYASERC